MAERFNLTAQIQLQAPTNTAQVVGQIRKQLQGINVDVKVKANTPQVAKLNKELQGVSKASDASAKSVRLMNASLVQAAKRFSIFTVVTGSLIALTRGIKNGTKEAIAFEKELIKISQVTGKSVARLQDLTKEVTRLSTSLGVSSSELLNVSRTLAQAGFSAQKTKQALETLAQTTLAATFDNIKDTTEGAIAVLRQFSDESRRAGGDIKFLASTMDAINSVSKRFAVESGDLITVIRRVGGVFSAAGGKVNELIALFTSVRATTRESAETIATGLRTIFTRIQRTDTVDQLKALGIQLRDSKGQFVGAYEAVRRLSVGLGTLDPRDFRFSDIVESLGGFRQVGKVIPLIQQFATAQAALSVAQSSSGSVARDAAKAQLGLGVEITKVKEEFGALLRQFADSSTFRSIAGGALQLASAFIKIASALEKVLPLITTMISMKIGQALAPGLGALIGGVGLRRKNQGGKIHAFARGGHVPGTGNRDTVPAMLQPGEFVIKKSSAKKLGSSTLEAMNNNRYAGGGMAEYPSARPYVKRPKIELRKDAGTEFDKDTHAFNKSDSLVFNRVKDKTIDVKQLNPKRKDVIEYYKARNRGERQRGIAFEGVAERQLNLTLARGSSRIDARAGNQLYEIKSEKKALSDQRLGEKLIGAAIRPRGQIDKVAQGRLKAEGLTSRANAVDLKSIGVIQDVTGRLGKQTKKDMKDETKVRTNVAGSLRRGQRRALGGMIQKFALGGIANVSKIGAAILDPDQKMGAESVSVGVGDVKRYVTGTGTEADRAKKGVSSVYKGKKYSIARQGLNKKTSDGFKQSIYNGLADGLDSATSGLGTDLGLGSATLDPAGRQSFMGYIAKRGNVIGDLFESATNSLQNKGKFSAEAIGAPFDFPGGLSGALADNFSNLPSSYVDAKSSYGAASTANLKNKIAQELAAEYKRSGDYAKFAKPRKKAALGGGISGSDTVPALLTPGEFVINKSTAESIGYSNLNKMNQTGVKGFATGGPVGVQRSAGGGAVAGGVAGLDKMAQAAQQFAFLGAMAASVGSQFTSLEETTQAAISATSASVASWVGIGGTLVQVFTAMAGAGTTAAAADMEEAAASRTAAASGGGISRGLGLFAIGLTAAYAAAEFFKQTLIAESAALTKSISESIKRLEEGTGTGAGIAGEQLQQVELDVATKEFSTLNIVIAVATTALAALVGMFAFFTAPAWGTVAAVTALGGALGGLLGFYQESTDATEKAAEAAKRQEEAIKASAAAMIASKNSLKSFNDAVTDLGERQFADTAAGRSEKIQATRDVVSQGLGSFGGETTADANNRLEALAKTVGKSTGELTAADFKGDNVEFKGEFENLISILETNSEGLKGALQQAQSNFTAAIKEDVTGELGFEQLRAKNGNFAKTLDQLRQATEASFKAERQRVQALIASTHGDKEANDAAVKQMNDLNKREIKILGEQEKYAKDVVVAAQERYEADLQAAQAAQELSRRMDAISQFTKDVELLGQAAKDAANAMDLRIAAFSDGDIQVKIPEISGLADPTNVADPDRFNQQIDSLIADLPRAMQSGADQQADTIRQASDLFGGFRSSVRGRRVGLGESVPEEAERILAASGLNLPRGGQLEKQVLADLVKALNEPGGLSDKAFDDIFKFVKDEADEAAKNLGELNKTRQVEIDTHKKYITALDAQRQRENSARQRLIQTQIKGEKIRAQARGESFDINRMEASRRAQAQVSLRGTNLRAGDAQGAFAAILDARLRRQDIANRLSGVDLGTDKYKQLASEQLKYNNIIKAAQGELKRLGDQSGRVADLQAEIAKEAKGRKQFAELGTSFAFGSDKGRQDMAKGLADTRLAIGSMRMGRGLQGATENQRASVASILDSLSDYRGFGVANPLTGEQMSGKEIKAELARQEVLRTTGDQVMAAAISGEILKGSKEEQLINSLDMLTREMEKANRLASDAEQAMGNARGGLVYRADGGSIFQPKGTDTVPAMLTPGEFVIKKSSVDRIGVGNLQALNDGVQYRQGGGSIRGKVRKRDEAKTRAHLTLDEADLPAEVIGVAGSAMGTSLTRFGNPLTGRNLGRAVGGEKGALIGEGVDIAAEGIGGAISGGAKAAGTGLLAGYGAAALTEFAGEAVSLALDPEATTQRYADANTRQTQQGYLSNVGENLIHPGRAAMQLGQSVIGGKKHQRQTLKPISTHEVPETHADYGKISDFDKSRAITPGRSRYHQHGGVVQYLKNGKTVEEEEEIKNKNLAESRLAFGQPADKSMMGYVGSALKGLKSARLGLRTLHGKPNEGFVKNQQKRNREGISGFFGGLTRSFGKFVMGDPETAQQRKEERENAPPDAYDRQVAAVMAADKAKRDEKELGKGIPGKGTMFKAPPNFIDKANVPRDETGPIAQGNKNIFGTRMMNDPSNLWWHNYEGSQADKERELGQGVPSKSTQFQSPDHPFISPQQRIADQKVVDALPAQRAREEQQRKDEAIKRQEEREFYQTRVKKDKDGNIERKAMTKAEATRAMDDPDPSNPLYIPYHKRTRAEQKMLEDQRTLDINAANDKLQADKTAGEARLEASKTKSKSIYDEIAATDARQAKAAKKRSDFMGKVREERVEKGLAPQASPETRYRPTSPKAAEEFTDYEKKKYGPGGLYDSTKPFVGPDQQRRSDELDTYTNTFFNRDAKESREKERRKSIQDLRDARDAKNTAADDARAQKLDKQKDMSPSDIRAASEQRVKEKREQRNKERRQRILDSDKSHDEKQELLKRYSGSKRYSREESMAASKKRRDKNRSEDRAAMTERNKDARTARLDAFISPEKRDERDDRRAAAFDDQSYQEKKAQDRRNRISKNRQAAANKKRQRQKFRSDRRNKARRMQYGNSGLFSVPPEDGLDAYGRRIGGEAPAAAEAAAAPEVIAAPLNESRQKTADEFGTAAEPTPPAALPTDIDAELAKRRAEQDAGDAQTQTQTQTSPVPEAGTVADLQTKIVNLTAKVTQLEAKLEAQQTSAPTTPAPTTPIVAPTAPIAAPTTRPPEQQTPEEYRKDREDRGRTGGAGGWAAGGSIPSSSDTVPAMLTPGEFVMSREAVQSHGVGYMKHLNKGHIPGFRRGGVVGTGGVQYKQEGGQIGGGGGIALDTSNLSDILANFNTNLTSGLDGIVSQFASFSESFTNLAATFSNLSMQHSFSGDMTLAFNITNADAIKNAVADAISPKITEIITNELDVRLNKDFQAGP